MSARLKPMPQDELTLCSLAPHLAFPGRTNLYIPEVAKHLAVTRQHVVNLIKGFEESGGELGLKGNSIALKWKAGDRLPEDKQSWRVAVSDLDVFVAKRATSHL